MSAKTLQLTAWNDRLAEAVAAVGSAAFPRKLETALSQLVDFDICMVFSYSRRQTVRSLYHNLEAETARVVISDYMAGAYVLDPFYEETRKGRREGFRSLRELAPDRFYQSEYYQQHYIRTGIRDEMGLFFPVAPDITAVLSVTRQKDKRQFQQAEKARFASAASLIKVLGSGYWSARADRQTETEGPSEPASVKKAIDTAFARFGQDVLSEREREIVAYVLKGHSTASIALHLEITPGTVKNHRRNAYAKLQISSQAELFSAFVGSLHSGGAG